jgi:hypothetical protein
MHAPREKQVAFNKRILENEDEVSAINSGREELNRSVDSFGYTNIGLCHPQAPSHPAQVIRGGQQHWLES